MDGLLVVALLGKELVVMEDTLRNIRQMLSRRDWQEYIGARRGLLQRDITVALRGCTCERLNDDGSHWGGCPAMFIAGPPGLLESLDEIDRLISEARRRPLPWDEGERLIRKAQQITCTLRNTMSLGSRERS